MSRAEYMARLRRIRRSGYGYAEEAMFWVFDGSRNGFGWPHWSPRRAQRHLDRCPNGYVIGGDWTKGPRPGPFLIDG